MGYEIETGEAERVAVESVGNAGGGGKGGCEFLSRLSEVVEELMSLGISDSISTNSTKRALDASFKNYGNPDLPGSDSERNSKGRSRDFENDIEFGY